MTEHEAKYSVENLAEMEDSQLLRCYADSGSEPAFAELVRRRIGLVYSVALRQTRGDQHRAQDATQAVFTDLARKAATLANRPVLAGWLYRSAQFAAAGLVRAEQRRRAREQEAHTMEKILETDRQDIDWDKVRPMLDQVLNEMDERDRDAILLRFFDGRPFGEIGTRLRLTENAARMRVERALDKLNGELARRGIRSRTAALGAALAQQASATIPAGLATTVTGTAFVQAAASGGIAAFLGLGKLQVLVVGAVATAGVAAVIIQQQGNNALRGEISELRQQQLRASALRIENQQLAVLASDVEMLRRDDAEFKQLAQRVAEAQQASAQRARAARQTTANPNTQAEIDRLKREGNVQVGEFKQLDTRAKDGSLTSEERANAETAAKDKLAAIQAKEREIQALIGMTRSSAPTPASLPSGILDAKSDARVGEEWIQVDEKHVTVRVPGATPAMLIAVYERISGRQVVRDASLESVVGKFDFQTPRPCTKLQLMQVIRTALHDNLNVFLAPDIDGRWVARVGMPQ